MYYSKEDIARAKETDMIDFISTKYNTSFIRQGSYYRCKSEDMSSLIIKNDRKKWFWNSQNQHGNGVIDWLVSIEKIEFTQAVGEVLGSSFESGAIETAAQSTNKRINSDTYFNGTAPKKHYDRQYKAATDYLHDVRGISYNVINNMMSQGKIYQDTRYNVVFANFDENKNIGYWCLRGTHQEKKFTMNMPGSNNPYYGFEVDSNCSSDNIFVFEAPIDLLSHCTIAEIKYGTDSWKKDNRLALCGVNDSALESYLLRHKNIKTIKFCLDNDSAGKNATNKLCEKYYNMGYKTQRIIYQPNAGKDLNEILCTHLKKQKSLSQKNIANKTYSTHSNNITPHSKPTEIKNAFEGKG